LWQEALAYRKHFLGMIVVASKVPLKDRSVVSLLYTPGVAVPCLRALLNNIYEWGG
jgi:malic enzyme